MRTRMLTGGYSLFELLMTLALATLIFALGLPSFGALAAEKRLKAEIDALFHAVHLARKISIVRRQVVSLCPSTDSASCALVSDWSRGWIMFANADRDTPPQVDRNEKILRQHAVNPKVKLTANRRAFTFRSTHLRATNGTVRVCDRSSRATPRALVISYTGRPRVATKDSRGNVYDCPD